MIRSKIRKINPERSNKMIFAVAGGLAVVLLVFFTLVIVGGRGSRGGSMARALDYLKNTDGLITVKAMDAEQRALIVYSSDSKNSANFEKIAYYAAVRLSRTWPDCRVQLAKNSAAQVVYEVVVKDGAIAGAGPVTAGTDRP